MKARYEADRDRSNTLEALVENEKTEKKRTATEGLLWLLRGLSFTCKALQYTQADKSKELAEGFITSYGETLKQFHNFVVKGIFSVRNGKFLYIPSFVLHSKKKTHNYEKKVAMKACPYRADFYKKLAADSTGGPPISDEKLKVQLDNWLDALSAIVTRMEAFYEKGGHKKGF